MVNQNICTFKIQIQVTISTRVYMQNHNLSCQGCLKKQCNQLNAARFVLMNWTWKNRQRTSCGVNIRRHRHKILMSNSIFYIPYIVSMKRYKYIETCQRKRAYTFVIHFVLICKVFGSMQSSVERSAMGWHNCFSMLVAHGPNFNRSMSAPNKGT